MNTTTRRPTRAAAPLDTDWRAYAACATVDPEIFFPVGNKPQAATQTQEAKRVCGGCHVRQRCLEWALETGQHTGVWGGLDEDERRNVSQVRESSMTLCLNRQEWIEEQLAAGRSQKGIARELGVYTSLLCRAIRRFQDERAAGFVGSDAA